MTSAYVYPGAKDKTANSPSSFKTSNLGTNSNVYTATQSSFWLAALNIHLKAYTSFSSFSSPPRCCAQRSLYPKQAALNPASTCRASTPSRMDPHRPRLADWPSSRVKGWMCSSSLCADNWVGPGISSETNYQENTSSVSHCSPQSFLLDGLERL